MNFALISFYEYDECDTQVKDFKSVNQQPTLSVKVNRILFLLFVNMAGPPSPSLVVVIV